MSAAERIQQWHWGKILMLWILVPTLGVAVGAIVLAVADAGFQSEVPESFFIFVLFPPLVSIVLMLVITWVWLTGKDRR